MVTSTRRSSSLRRASTGASRTGPRMPMISRAPSSAFGVPAEVIVAILGVESFYGKYTGGYRTVDVLTTRVRLSAPVGLFAASSSSSCFSRASSGCRALTAKGLVRRRARRSAVHAGKLQELRRRLRRQRPRGSLNSPADVIGSVANYLARHDWQPGQPVLLDGDDRGGRARCSAAQARRRICRSGAR